MARQRISEYRAKSFLFSKLNLTYKGVSVNAEQEIAPQVTELDREQKYIVKVDQGVKKRMKRGLIALNKDISEIPAVIEEIKTKGFNQFLIEPMASYDQQNEKYFAIERIREGCRVSFSSKGGIDIEEHAETLSSVVIPYSGEKHEALQKIKDEIGLSQEIVEKILAAFDEYFVSFLEINPLVIQDSDFMILDLAVEVDSVAEFFVRGAWTAADFTNGEVTDVTEEEKTVEELAANSQAAFTLRVLHPDGAIFMLLSGGGASIVLADEVANLGFGHELANYGEYSGNPNTEETYIYTKQVLSLLAKSSASKKVLIVGGGVANFTDVKKTFKGLIQAFEEEKETLRGQGVKIFVRRGGPNQDEGLAMMKAFLEKEGLYGMVVGPEIVLTNIVQDAIKTL